MAVLLISVTLVRDLKIKNIGLNFSIENSASSNQDISSQDTGYFSFVGDEYSETGEEEEEGEEENDLEDDDLFFSIPSNHQISIMSFHYTFNYRSPVSSFILCKTTPPPRNVWFYKGIHRPFSIL